VTSSVIWY